MKKTIAVTGSGGFLGQYVKAVVEGDGHEFIPFDKRDGNDILGDLSALEGATTVIHMAGMLGTAELFDNPNAAVEANVVGTLRILQWCEQNGAGFVGITMPDSSWANVYQATKLCAMRLATAWHRNMGVPVSHVRAFNAYGPGQAHGAGHPQKIIPTFAKHSWNREPIPIWGNGLQTVDLVSAKSIAMMLVNATRFGDDQIFDAGTGVAMTVNKVAEMVNRLTESDAGVAHLPMRKGEEEDTHIIAKGEGWDLLGWQPDIDFAELERTVQWYKPLIEPVLIEPEPVPES